MTIRWSRPVIYLLLLLFAAFYLMPMYVVAVTGLKSYSQVSLDTMWNLPVGIHFDSFVKAFQSLWPNLWNSIRIAVPAAILSSFLGSINGYVFAKWRFPGSDRLFTLVIFGIFMPYQAVLIPLVLTLQRIGLYGSIPGVIFVHTIFGIPITALIFRSYFGGVPTEVVDAAKMDGAGFFGIYRWIMFPISMPAFAVVLIWQFTSIWNDFLIAVTILSNPTVQPVTVALNNLQGSFFTEWNIQMAGALIAALPTIIVYLALGRLFMRGLLAGSLKG